jgi:hypothetical protein
MPERSELRDLIEPWLCEAAWVLEDLVVDSRTAWGIKATDRESLPLPVAVYELATRPGMIILQTDAQGQNDQFEVLRGNDDLLLDLQSMLLKHHVEFNLESGRQKIVIIDRIFAEGLTKNLFWRRLSIVRMAAVDALIFLRRCTGGASNQR